MHTRTCTRSHTYTYGELAKRITRKKNDLYLNFSLKCVDDRHFCVLFSLALSCVMLCFFQHFSSFCLSSLSVSMSLVLARVLEFICTIFIFQSTKHVCIVFKCCCFCSFSALLPLMMILTLFLSISDSFLSLFLSLHLASML